MKQAKFIYVDKQKNVYPFVMKLNNEHNTFDVAQVVQLKEIGLTTPKLYDLIAVEMFVPRLHHSKPTVIFDQYIEQEESVPNFTESEFAIAKIILRNWVKEFEGNHAFRKQLGVNDIYNTTNEFLSRHT